MRGGWEELGVLGGTEGDCINGKSGNGEADDVAGGLEVEGGLRVFPARN